MESFEFLKTRGKSPDHIKSDRCIACEGLVKIGLLMSSLSGVGALPEVVVHVGEVDWGTIELMNIFEFYLWPEKMRWMVVLAMLCFFGFTLIASGLLIKRILSCNE